MVVEMEMLHVNINLGDYEMNLKIVDFDCRPTSLSLVRMIFGSDRMKP